MSSKDRPSKPEAEAAAERKAREAGLDDTIEQTFPASDPASTIPNPREPDLVDEREG